MQDDHRFLPAGTVLVDSFRVRRGLGAGAFSVAYEAEDLTLGTTVAIKEYFPQGLAFRAPTFEVGSTSEGSAALYKWGRDAFLRDARALARFRHPAIVRVLRVFETNATAYVVMEYEDGSSFEHWLRQLGRPPTQAELDRILSPLLDALDLLHRADVLHRNIAPETFIVRSDLSPMLCEGEPARISEVDATEVLPISNGYAAPELYNKHGRQQGPWTDIYALGATLYRAVTGTAPEESVARMLSDTLRPAALAANGTYRLAFLRAIDACLDLQTAKRPQSISDLRTLLTAPDDAPRARPLARRSPTRVIAGLGGIALLCAAAVAGFKFWEPRTTAAQPDSGIIDTVQPARSTLTEQPHVAITEQDKAAHAQRSRADDLVLDCDRRASDPTDPERVVPAVILRYEDAQGAIDACTRAFAARPDLARMEYQLARALTVAERFADAQSILARRAAAREPRGMVGLGNMYANGTIAGGRVDYVQALDLFRAAATAGDTNGFTSLSWSYLLGRGVPRDNAAAVSLLRQAAARNDAAAMLRLAAHLKQYAVWRGVNRDAYEWIAKAAGLRHAPAMVEQAVWLLKGSDVPADPQTANTLIEDAIGIDGAQSAFNAALGLRFGTDALPSAALSWYRRCVTLDPNFRACLIGLSDMLRKLGQVAEANDFQARYVEQVKRATDRGESYALAQLAEMHENGDGVPKDLDASVQLYQRAAAKGNVKALASLVYMYGEGVGVPTDRAESERYYALLAPRRSFFDLSTRYRSLEPKLFAWAQRARADGMDGTDSTIVMAYRWGKGTTRDRAEALRATRRAAERGDDLLTSWLIEELLKDNTASAQDIAEAANWSIIGIKRWYKYTVEFALKTGNRYSYVRQLQDNLRAEGVFTGASTGNLDEETRAAMERLAKAEGEKVVSLR